MASVYKSISKKRQERPVSDVMDDEDDIDMNDLIDEDTSDSDDDDDEEEEVQENTGDVSSAQQKAYKEGFMPKTRVLMLTSRGVTHRYVPCFKNDTVLFKRAPRICAYLLTARFF